MRLPVLGLLFSSGPPGFAPAGFGGRRGRWAPCLALVGLMWGPPEARAAICRVATDGVAIADGSSWASPTTLLDALANGNGKSCTEIWVKRGAYKPTDGADRTLAFAIDRPLLLYGGFAGTELMLASRTTATIASNPAVLSGDIDGNDSVDADGVTLAYTDATGSNSFHVLVIGGTGAAGNGIYTPDNTVIDGFVITAGSATGGASPDNTGGGLFCNGRTIGRLCSPRIANVRFSGNRAAFGGAMYNLGAASGASSPVASHVAFSRNRAESAGGAVYNEANAGTSSPIFSDTSFDANSAPDGGALFNNGYNLGASSPVLSRVSFTSNLAPAGEGGAMYNNGDSGTSSPSLSDVSFIGNDASLDGGAMYNFANGVIGECRPVVDGATFSANIAAGSSGGAISSRSIDNANIVISVRNATFVGNSATYGGAVHASTGIGALYQAGFNNVTFSGNTAGNGSVMYTDRFAGSATATLVNSVVVVPPGSAFDGHFSLHTINYGVYHVTGAASVCPAVCNDTQFADPKLGPLADNGGWTRTLLPAEDSPAIDGGSPDPMLCPVADQRGVARPQRLGCDVGAVELAPPIRIFGNGFEGP